MRALICLLLAFGTTLVLRERVGAANAERNLHQFRYTPDPALSKLLAGAHRSTTADMLWLRALPDFSRHFDDLEQKKRWLHGVLDTVTGLEPEFVTAYTYGSAYFELIEKKASAVIDLLKQGVASNPDNIELKVKLAMAYLMHAKDRPKAIEQLQQVVNDPRCDALTAGLCASLLVDEREDIAALSYWVQYLEYDNEDVQEVARLYYERAKKRIFIRAFNEFETKYGRPPQSVDELRGKSLIAEPVEQEVLSAGVISAAGSLEFPDLVELEVRKTFRAAEGWCSLFRDENRRWPTMAEFREKSRIPLPRAPVGQRFVLSEGQLRLEPIPAGES